MKPGKMAGLVTGGNDAIIKLLSWLACGLVFIMALVVFGNVVGRYFLNKPLLGTVELAELMMVVIAFFSIPYTEKVWGHVRVDVVISRLSRRTQAILASIAFFISTGTFAVISYKAIVNAIYYAHHLLEATSVLFIPIAPFMSVMALGCLVLTLKLLAHLFHPLPPEEGQEGGLK